MRIECKDFDRAVQSPELLPDLRAHAKECERCRRELYLWTELSNAARELHAEWESPTLWPKIEVALKAEPRRRRAMPVWRLAAAAAVLVAVFGVWRWQGAGGGEPSSRASRDLLTEQALRELEVAEVAYARSIEKLALLAEADLKRDPSPLAANYREKLVLLDSAIAEIKSNVERNQYNAHLRTELASLYREKQATLQEWLRNANRN
ncbi:MAG: hypothetical protein SFV54_27435 [Bryobacteraceae bacterium]|nr:hypothetical protein [Bryobacteraceae bacterium]